MGHAPDVLRHDSKVGRVQPDPLGLGPVQVSLDAPAVPLLFLVPRNLAAVEGPEQARMAVGAHPLACRGDAMPSSFNSFAIRVKPMPSVQSANIRRTTAACPSLMRRTTCSRRPSAPATSTLSYPYTL